VSFSSEHYDNLDDNNEIIDWVATRYLSPNWRAF